MAVLINQIEHQGVIYQPFYRMNGDAEFFQSPNGNVYHLKQGRLTCAFAKFEMDANGVFTKKSDGVQEQTRG